MRPLLIFILGCSIWLQPMNAQNRPYFKHFTKEQGLASNKINCILQDRAGYMWFGTEDGLVRFDGTNFETFRHDPDNEHTLSHDIIVCLYEDPVTGNMLVGTGKGLNLFNKTEYKFYRDYYCTPDDSLLSKKGIQSIMIDKKGNRWIGIYNGFYIFSEEGKLVFKAIKPDEYSAGCIFQDSRQNIWIGSSKGIEQFDWETKSLKPHFGINDKVRCIYEDRRNNLWISTDSKNLYVCNNGRVQNYGNENKLFKDKKIFAIAEDAKGNILFAPRDGGGLFQLNYKTGTTTLFAHDIFNPNSISSSGLLSIYKDNFGNIWIGTYNSGLNLIDINQKPFDHYCVNFRSSGLFNNYIRSAFQDSDGDIWIGTKEEGGLSRFDPETGMFVHYRYTPNNPSGIHSKYILSIAEAKRGILLIGTLQGGLELFDKSTNTFRQLKNDPGDKSSLANNDVFLVFRDRFDTIWVSTTKVLQKFDIKKRTFSVVPGITEVRSIVDFSSDEIYFGSSRGLYIYNRTKAKFKKYSNVRNDSTSISDRNINCMVKDGSGNMWIGTYRGGLCYLDTKTLKFRTYTTKHGLPSNLIRAMETDHRGNLWMSTANGLSRFNPVTKTFKNYYVTDGLQGNDFERFVGLKTRSGHLLFGGGNGFNYFFPDSIRDNLQAPEIVITNFKIFNKPVAVNGPNSPLKQHISLTKAIKLTYKQSVISFEFVAINYSSPQNNQYAYMLEGFDQDWNYIGNKQNAIYMNLPPGKFTFRVKASNNDGVWNHNGAFLTITVLPPWWRTWWFKSLFALSLIGVALLFVRYRTRRLRYEKLKLEQLVADRTQSIELQNKQIAMQRDQLVELNHEVQKNSEMRDQFFTRVSHEFRTPLSLIASPVDRLKVKHVADEETQQYLRLIKRNSDRLLELVNELMTFRAIETHNASLKLSKINIVAFIRDIAGCFVDYAKQCGLELKVYPENDTIDTYIDTAVLEKILYNLMNNAIKYTPTGGKVEIFIRSSELHEPNPDVVIGEVLDNCRYVSISIKDDGIGIKSENLQLIFNEFYREQSAEGIVGSGIGLALTKELVRLHKGVLTVSSTKGEGSQFTVKLPSDKVYYDDPEIVQNEYTLEFSKTKVNQFIEDQRTVYRNPDGESSENKKAKKAHVLIVEDNHDLRNFMVKELSVLFKVSEADNGEDGLAMAIKLSPDLIVSDILMPKMNGWDLCKMLKEELHTCHIPVILLTALTENKNQVAGFESGADDYVLKPFDITVLLARIQNLILSRSRLRQVFNNAVVINPAEITTNSKDEKFLQKALDIVNENISNPEFNVTMFVDRMCISKSVVHEKLTSLINQSAVEFITSVRLKKATQLMQNPELSIADISLMVGYLDQSYFSRCFKKQFGKSPKEYIEFIRLK